MPLLASPPSPALAPARRAPLSVAGGTLEALKWLAFALMVLDHANKWRFGGAIPYGFELGRLAFPIFAFVLAHHLAQPGALARGVHARVMRRLALWGAIATPPFMALVGSAWPLNILFTLLAGAAIVWGLERRDAAGIALAALAFALGGLVVDYQHPGLAMFVAAWAFCRWPTPSRAAVWTVATAGLVVVNQNFWALAALPLLWLAPALDLRLPRARWLFYAAYPGHLLLLAWLARGGA